MNTNLLLKVADRIRKEPKSYDQRAVVRSSTDSPCGTTYCIAGHAIAEVEGNFTEHQSGCFAKGAEILGLTIQQADRLFCGGALFWPEPYRTDYQSLVYGPEGERRDIDREKVAIVVVGFLEAIANGKVKL